MLIELKQNTVEYMRGKYFQLKPFVSYRFILYASTKTLWLISQKSITNCGKKNNKIVEDNDPALVDRYGLSSLSTSKRVFVHCLMKINRYV